MMISEIFFVQVLFVWLVGCLFFFFVSLFVFVFVSLFVFFSLFVCSSSISGSKASVDGASGPGSGSA